MATLNCKRSAVPVDALLVVTGLPNNTTFPTTQFPAWTCPVPTKTFTSSVVGQAVLGRSDNTSAAMAITNATWRDVSTTTYMFNGCFVNRFANGRGIYLRFNGNNGGGFEVGVLKDMDLTKPMLNGTLYALYSATHAQMEARFGPTGSVVAAGFTQAYAPGHAFSLVTVGFDIQVKFKGTTILNFPGEAISCMDPGKVVLAPVETYGILDTVADFLPLVKLQSDMTWASSNRKLVLSEMGWKNTKTTGSMAAGSPVLNVASAAGLAINDYVIVATGGEATGGARGAPGVGGYLNDDGQKASSLAALLALPPANDGKKGFVINPASPDHARSVQGSLNSDIPEWYPPEQVTVTVGNPGRIYKQYWNIKEGWPVTFAGGTTLPSGWVAGTTYYVKSIVGANSEGANFALSATPFGAAINTTGAPGGPHRLWYNQNWYVDFIAPKALRAKIIGISGTTITLDQTAKVATTNAEVYHDNIAKSVHIERLAWLYPDNVRCIVSGLRNAVSRWISVNNRPGWSIEGATGPTVDGLITPKGSPCQFAFFFQSNNSGIRKLELIGNHALVGYGLDWSITTGLGTPLPKGVVFLANNIFAEDLRIFNVVTEAVSINYNTQTDSTVGSPYGVKRVFVQQDLQPQHYMGWILVDASSQNVTYDDCNIVRPGQNSYGSGFETFQSEGSKFRNCTALNCTHSVNSAGATEIINFTSTHETNILGNNTISNPAHWNLNTNQDNLQGNAVVVHIGTPTVIESSSAHGYVTGQPIGFAFFGTVPAGMSTGTPYYVTTIIDNYNFRFSADPGGANINTTGTYTGNVRSYTATPVTFVIGSDMITVANSGMHDFAVGSAVAIRTGGALPTGITAGFPYIVVAVDLMNRRWFKISAFKDGAPIVATGTQSGGHSATRIVSDLVSKGAKIINSTFIMQGWSDTQNQASFFGISNVIPNVEITGTHPAGTGAPYTKGTNPKGYFFGPETSPGSSFGVADIRNDAPGLIITGVRFASNFDPVNPFIGRISNSGSVKIGSSVYNTGALTNYGILADVGGNVTNTAWLAAHTPNDG